MIIYIKVLLKKRVILNIWKIFWQMSEEKNKCITNAN